MKKSLLVAALVSSFATSGCAALLGAGAGATAVACTDDDVNCPPTEVAETVDEEIGS